MRAQPHANDTRWDALVERAVLLRRPRPLLRLGRPPRAPFPWLFPPPSPSPVPPVAPVVRPPLSLRRPALPPSRRLRFSGSPAPRPRPPPRPLLCASRSLLPPPSSPAAASSPLPSLRPPPSLPLPRPSGLGPPASPPRLSLPRSRPVPLPLRPLPRRAPGLPLPSPPPPSPPRPPLPPPPSPPPPHGYNQVRARYANLRVDRLRGEQLAHAGPPRVRRARSLPCAARGGLLRRRRRGRIG